MNKYKELAKKLNLISDKDVCCDCEDHKENPFGIEKLKDRAYEERSKTALCLSDILAEFYTRMKSSEAANEKNNYELYLKQCKIEYLEEENSMLKNIIDKLIKEEAE